MAQRGAAACRSPAARRRTPTTACRSPAAGRRTPATAATGRRMPAAGGRQMPAAAAVGHRTLPSPNTARRPPDAAAATTRRPPNAAAAASARWPPAAATAASPPPDAAATVGLWLTPPPIACLWPPLAAATVGLWPPRLPITGHPPVAPQSEKNKEMAKMEGDAVEPDTGLQPQFHPSASCRDHEINEAPPMDDVREGTPPGNQNQTGEQDLNPQSNSPLLSTKLRLQLNPYASSQNHEINEEPPTDNVREGTLPGNQNQTRQQDLNPSSISPLSSTELQLQFHPSASSQDHEINEVPPMDNVREGTPPGNQNQTREQDSNPSSLD